MLTIDNADGSLIGLTVLGPVPGNPNDPKVAVKAKMTVNLTEEQVQSLPFLSEAVCAIIADDHETDAAGTAPVSTHIACKRSFDTSTYTLIGQDVSVDIHGDVAGRATIKIVASSAALVWTVQANVNPYDLPTLSVLVGDDSTQLTIEPQQMDLATILEMGRTAAAV